MRLKGAGRGQPGDELPALFLPYYPSQLAAGTDFLLLTCDIVAKEVTGTAAHPARGLGGKLLANSLPGWPS